MMRGDVVLHAPSQSYKLPRDRGAIGDRNPTWTVDATSMQALRRTLVASSRASWNRQSGPRFWHPTTWHHTARWHALNLEPAASGGAIESGVSREVSLAWRVGRRLGIKLAPGPHVLGDDTCSPSKCGRRQLQQTCIARASNSWAGAHAAKGGVARRNEAGSKGRTEGRRWEKGQEGRGDERSMGRRSPPRDNEWTRGTSGERGRRKHPDDERSQTARSTGSRGLGGGSNRGLPLISSGSEEEIEEVNEEEKGPGRPQKGATGRSNSATGSLTPFKKSSSTTTSSSARLGSASSNTSGPREPAGPGIIGAAADKLQVPRVQLKRGKAALFREGGSPFVFSGAVDCVVGRPAPKAGASVAVADGEGRVFAWGVFNPTSMYRVRIMQTEADAVRFPSLVLNMPGLISQRVTAAVDLRARLGLHMGAVLTSATSADGDASTSAQDSAAMEDHPVAQGWREGGHEPRAREAAPDATNVFRLINSEGDRLSGLVVDVFGDRLVVSSSAAWVEAYRPHILSCLQQVLLWSPGSRNNSGIAQERLADGEERVVWRQSLEMLREEGWVVGTGKVGVAGQGSDSEDAEQNEGMMDTSADPDEAAIEQLEAQDGHNDAPIHSLEEDSDEVDDTDAADLDAVVPGGAEDEEGREQEQDGRGAMRSDSALVQVLEHGVAYAVSLQSGQKTGFYADQRDSRLLVRQLVAAQVQGAGADVEWGEGGVASGLDDLAVDDRPWRKAHGVRVLDLCCYTGGFAINAALGGAELAVGVDSSAPALRIAELNRRMNGISNSQCQFVKADILQYMRESLDAGETWDILILDPPKLAPSRKALSRALQRYRRLNSAAMRLVAPGGLLMTCSCSGAVTQSGVFPSVLQEAAVVAQRRITMMRVAGPGADHPVDPACPEGAYLTNILLRVE